MNRLLLSGVSLLVALCVALLAGVIAYHASYTYESADLTFDDFSLDGNRLTFSVRSDAAGEYVYRVLPGNLEDGKFPVTVRGGKQSALAQTPGAEQAIFTIELPEGTQKVVCGKRTIYTVK